MHAKTLTLAAILAIGLMSGVAMAQTIRRGPPPPDGHSDACVVLCTPTGDDPGVPGDPGMPGSPKAMNVAFKGCGDKLANLGRVTKQQIENVRDGRIVHLVPICDILNHSLTEDQASNLSRGNIQGLVTAIAGNQTLAAKLGGKGYGADDVVGVAIGSNAALLYVSHR